MTLTRHPCTNPDCKGTPPLGRYVDRTEWAAGIRICGRCRREEKAKRRLALAQAAIQNTIGRAI